MVVKTVVRILQKNKGSFDGTNCVLTDFLEICNILSTCYITLLRMKDFLIAEYYFTQFYIFS